MSAGRALRPRYPVDTTVAAVPRFLAAVTIAFFPIFLANLIFAGRFRDSADPTSAFGVNLLGAMLGGTLEYLSLVVGFRALLLVVGILYLFAYLTRPKDRGRVPHATDPSGVEIGAPA